MRAGGWPKPRQKIGHAKKANDNVVSLDAVRSARARKAGSFNAPIRAVA
jgi:hypothetical protein